MLILQIPFVDKNASYMLANTLFGFFSWNCSPKQLQEIQIIMTKTGTMTNAVGGALSIMDILVGNEALVV